MTDRVMGMGGCFAVVVAAGRGRRFGAELPKQYHPLAGRSVLHRTVRAFLDHPQVDGVRVVIGPDDRPLHDEATAGLPVLEPCLGGESRQDSVRRGLESLADLAPDTVLIHDAARPLVDPAAISGVIAACASGGGGIAAVPVVDTLKRAGDANRIADTVDRTALWRAQTPQGFAYAAILAAHRKAAGDGVEGLTDDAAVAEFAGLPVALVPSSEDNMKITAKEDLARAAQILRSRGGAPAGGDMATRIGTAYDVHRLIHHPADTPEADRFITLAGVRIPFRYRLSGHSDADIALHVVTDALLGAIAAGDIGTHFPPSDPQWRGMASSRFLRHAADLTSARGGTIANVDVTLIAEAPKIGPFRSRMVDTIAGILDIPQDRISLKGTTSERLGFVGRGEGIAAQAVAAVMLAQ